MTDLTEIARKVIETGESAHVSARPWILEGTGNIPDIKFWQFGGCNDHPTDDERFIQLLVNHAPALAARVLELEEHKKLLFEENTRLLTRIEQELEPQVEKLRAALEEASKWIHEEICTDAHDGFCDELRKALSGEIEMKSTQEGE